METMLMNPWAHIAVLASFTIVVTVWDNAMWDRKAFIGVWKLVPLFK